MQPKVGQGLRAEVMPDNMSRVVLFGQDIPYHAHHAAVLLVAAPILMAHGCKGGWSRSAGSYVCSP